MPRKINAILPTDTLFPTRGEEIEYFLDDYKTVPYVIIDDEDDGFSPAMKRRWIYTDPASGLTQDDVNMATHILNNR